MRAASSHDPRICPSRRNLLLCKALYNVGQHPVLTCLNFIYYEHDAMFLCDCLQALKESWRGMIIASFTLDRFNDDPCNGAVPVS